MVTMDFGTNVSSSSWRIVTRLETKTPFVVAKERPVPAGTSNPSDRSGYLPNRLAASRRDPMSILVREVTVMIDSGKVSCIFTNDLTASAQESAMTR